MKLFAMDLDGTLLDHQDAIHPRDAAAIARALEQGVIVTIATGRLTSRTHPTARALGLRAPLICADGGVLACGETERILEQRPIARSATAHALSLFAEQGLSRFVLTHEAVHSCRLGARYHHYIRGWSQAITAHDDLHMAPLLRSDVDAAIMLVGVGDREQVERAEQALAPLLDQLEIMRFEAASAHMIRLMSKGTNKGSALLALARQLAVPVEHVAVIGDWLNDLSMFEVAGHAFAMPHAPDALKAKASHVLDAEAPARGAIADALEHWLSALR